MSTKQLAKASLYYYDPADLTIVEDEKHELHDPEKDRHVIDEGLVQSIIDHGVIQPVKVVPGEGPFKGRTIVADGRRRVRHTQIARERLKKRGADHGTLPMVPVFFCKGDDDGVASMIIGNNHALAKGVFQKAREASRMLSYGRSEDEVRSFFSISKTTLANWLQLLKAPKEHLEAVARGELSATEARKAATKVPPPEPTPAPTKPDGAPAPVRAAHAPPKPRAPRERHQWTIGRMRDWVDSRTTPEGNAIPKLASDNRSQATLELVVAVLAYVGGRDPDAEFLKAFPAARKALVDDTNKARGT